MFAGKDPSGRMPRPPRAQELNITLSGRDNFALHWFKLPYMPFSHPCVGPLKKARKWKKHAAQGVAAQPSMEIRVSSRAMGTAPQGSRGAGDRSVEKGQGLQQADSRFASLLAKGGAEAPVARRGAGIPGPWEPVAVPREV